MIATPPPAQTELVSVSALLFMPNEGQYLTHHTPLRLPSSDFSFTQSARA